MLQNVFRDIINHTYWLDEETKDLARLKIDYMNLKIGYPDFILRDEELASRYSDIKIHPERYFENMLSILRVRHVKSAFWLLLFLGFSAFGQGWTKEAGYTSE